MKMMTNISKNKQEPVKHSVKKSKQLKRMKTLRMQARNSIEVRKDSITTEEEPDPKPTIVEKYL